MKNSINEEINRTLFLFGYKPGKVISEQEHPELDESRGRKPKYTDDVIKQIASKYKTVKDFREKNRPIYDIAYKRKMLDDLFPDRQLGAGAPLKRTDDEVRREASKYNSERDFRENNRNAWQIANNRKMLDDLFPDRKTGGGRDIKYTDDEIRREASKYKTVPDFQENSPTIFSTARNRKMLDDLFPDRQIGSGRVLKYSDNDIRREALKYKTDKDFKEENYKVYQIAYKRKMIDDLYPNRKKNIPFNDDEVRREASKYLTDKDFKENNFNMWQKAYNKKMLDDLFPDRKTVRGRPKLTKKPEEIQNEPMGGIAHYWSSSPTTSLNVKPKYNYNEK
jgi:hypothetical protein